MANIAINSVNIVDDDYEEELDEDDEVEGEENLDDYATNDEDEDVDYVDEYSASDDTETEETNDADEGSSVTRDGVEEESYVNENLDLTEDEVE